MSSTTPPETRSLPTRVEVDRVAGRLTVVVDAAPADAADITVSIGSNRLRIRIDRDGTVFDRTVTAPPRWRGFTDEREAVCHNGVLTVTVGMQRRSYR
ncbi:hypothetical protein [Halopiger djelfimassiliensis]|uniref:hypothetical protein n=1 Tax=Halopiger djelfimassiliensis TaxID=1293047 RepID=UPI000677C55E|nr:hypothetical protein [Halopiger djelfimassiliensis]